MPLSSAAGGNQELQHVGSAASSAGHSLLGFFQMLACDDGEEEKLHRLYTKTRFLRNPDLALLSLVLSGLLTLSERADMVSRVLSGTDLLALGV